MKLFTMGNEMIRAKVTKAPTFSSHKGRIWESMEKTVDNYDVTFMYDTSWGKNLYFSFKDKYYKVKICLVRGRNTLDLRNIKKFSTRPNFLSMKKNRMIKRGVLRS